MWHSKLLENPVLPHTSNTDANNDGALQSRNWHEPETVPIVQRLEVQSISLNCHGHPDIQLGRGVV